MSAYAAQRRHLLTSLGIAATALPALGRAAKQQAASGERGAPLRRIAEFGATGDGHTDDSAAFERALATSPAGGVIVLDGGRSYRLTRSLVLTRPLAVAGSAKEETRLLFDDGRYAKLGGIAAAIILPHSVSAAANGGTARRTTMSGFTISWVGKSDTQLHGLLVATPSYLYEIDISSFPGNGFHIEASTDAIKGNANGSSFMNCSALKNRGHGFAFYGNDANACLLLGSRAFDNLQSGFFDGSLLGNTYVGAEVDGNFHAGFASVKSVPNRSIYLGCYAEPNQRYDLNPRNLVVGPLGHVSGRLPPMLRALPTGELFSSAAHIFASSEDAASSGGTAAAAYLRISDGGLDMRSTDGQRLRIAKLLSANYVDVLNGDQPLIRFPSGSVAANVTAERPWLPGGMVLGAEGKSGILGAGPRPPSKGSFAVGALWLNDAPRRSGFVGWVCVTSGRPGEWLAFGRIEDAA